MRLANQAKVQPIGHVSNLVVDIEGMKTHADFDVIKVVEDSGCSYGPSGRMVIYLKTRMSGSLLLWTLRKDGDILNL